jgi:hypothetical protein
MTLHDANMIGIGVCIGWAVCLCLIYLAHKL